MTGADTDDKGEGSNTGPARVTTSHSQRDAVPPDQATPSGRKDSRPEATERESSVSPREHVHRGDVDDIPKLLSSGDPGERTQAYQHLQALFEDGHNPSVYTEHSGVIKQAVVDLDSKAQSTALSMVQAYVDHAPTSETNRIAPSLSVLLRERCISPGTGSGTVSKARGVLLSLMECSVPGKAPAVMKALLSAFTHHIGPIAAACVQMVREGVRMFGAEALGGRAILTAIPQALHHKSDEVVKAAITLVVEMHRWIGPAVMKSVTDPGQARRIKQLTAAHSKEEVPSPERSRRDPVAASSPGPTNGAASPGPGSRGTEQKHADGNQSGEGKAALTPTTAPINVMLMLPPTWNVALCSPKIRVRAEAWRLLTSLLHAAPVVANTDWMPLVRAYIAVCKNETAGVVVAAACNSVRALVEKLGHVIHIHCKRLLPSQFQRLGDADPGTRDALNAMLDAEFKHKSITLVTMFDAVKASMGPSVATARKVAITQFIQRCVNLTTLGNDSQEDGSAVVPATDAQKKDLAKQYAGVLSLLVSSGDHTLSTHAVKLAAAFVRLVGAPTLMPLLGKLDIRVKAKIQDAANIPLSPQDVSQKKTRRRPTTGITRPYQSGSPEPSKPTSPHTGGSGGKRRAQSAKTRRPLNSLALSPKDQSALASMLVPRVTLDLLSSGKWQDRLAGLDSVAAALPSMQRDRNDLWVEALVGLLGSTPGWHDANYTVCSRSFELLSDIALAARRIPPVVVRLVVPAVAQKLSDIKVCTAARACLSSLAAASSPKLVTQCIIDLCIDSKNRKVYTSSSQWLLSTLGEFSSKTLPVTAMLRHAKRGLKNQSLDQSTRNACIAIVGAIGADLGPDAIESEISDLNESIQSQIARAIAKGPLYVAAEEASEGQAGGQGGSSSHDDDGSAPSMLDLDRRFPSRLQNQLGSSVHKECVHALDQLDHLLASNEKVPIHPKVGAIVTALRARVQDRRHDIQFRSLELLAKIVDGVRAAIKPYVRILVPAAGSALTSTQGGIRGAALDILDALARHVPFTALVPRVCDAFVELKGSEEGSRDLLAWLQASLSYWHDSPACVDLVKPVLQTMLCAPLRQAAEGVMSSIVKYPAAAKELLTRVNDIKRSEARYVEPFLDQHGLSPKKKKKDGSPAARAPSRTSGVTPTPSSNELHPSTPTRDNKHEDPAQGNDDADGQGSDPDSIGEADDSDEDIDHDSASDHASDDQGKEVVAQPAVVAIRTNGTESKGKDKGKGKGKGKGTATRSPARKTGHPTAATSGASSGSAPFHSSSSATQSGSASRGKESPGKKSGGGGKGRMSPSQRTPANGNTKKKAAVVTRKFAKPKTSPYAAM